MIQIGNLTKQYGVRTLFHQATLSLEKGDKVALVGRNGQGKSSLLKMIYGEELSDQGTIRCPKNYRLGFLRQHISFSKPTLYAELQSVLPEAMDGEKSLDYKVDAILQGLGFSSEQWDQPPQSLSGGMQLRVELGKLLLQEFDLLLLDEPTNYLDLETSRWLIQFLKKWTGELILVSHDRGFLEAIITHTVVIYNRGLRKMAGGIRPALDLLAQERATLQKTIENEMRKREQEMQFIRQSGARASTASLVQSRIKRLEKKDLERQDTLESFSGQDQLDMLEIKFDFPFHPMPAKTVLQCHQVSFGYDPHNLLFTNFSLTIGKQDRIGIIGKNGQGKSTLIKIFAGLLNPTQGTVVTHPQISLGYFGQTHIQALKNHRSIVEEIESEDGQMSRQTAKALSAKMLFMQEDSEKQIKVLSGGEKSRVLLAKLLAKKTNLLLLDEPTHHLDIETVESLLQALNDYPGAVVMVGHDEDLMKKFTKQCLIFDQGQIEYYPANYCDYLQRQKLDPNQGPANKHQENVIEKSKPDNFIKKGPGQKQKELDKMLRPWQKQSVLLLSEIEKSEENQKVIVDQLLVPNLINEKRIQLNKQLREIELYIETKYQELDLCEKEIDHIKNDFEN